MKFAVQVEAEDTEALDGLVSATEKWLKSMGATVLESMRDDEDLTAAYVVSTRERPLVRIRGRQPSGEGFSRTAGRAK